ncbi:MAG TPA: hypothetical protein VNZ64_03865 [Candidatus Acidoferrum sp.]|jgi:hypothetical protein|nr:hypothetical protein [Candidatus Acidoferrum sp.]
MKNMSAWAGALALAVVAFSQMETKGAYTNSDGLIITNGVVLITTRTAVDAFWRQQSSSSIWDADDAKGPGSFSPGDAAMGELLGDYGYTVRMVPEEVLHYMNVAGGTATDWLTNPNNPLNYYQGGGGPSSTTSNVLWSAMLVIMSGSGSSADMAPPNTNAIPIIAGENAVLGDSTAGVPSSHSELFFYGTGNGTKNTSNKTSPSVDGLYMTVVDTNHPIMQGIPVDAQGRVQIFRAPYPEEALHNAPGGKPNYEISWTCSDCSAGKSIPAPGLTILGRLSSNTNQVVFAVIDAGGGLADTTLDATSPWFNYTTAPARMVHFFVNEDGSGGIRRAFNALTDIGRVIFVRTCKWAMGETLTPYQPLGLIRVSQLNSQQIQLLWDGTASKNYDILGTRNLLDLSNPANWQTVVQDIPGSNGTVSVKLDISAGPQYAFLRVKPVP